MIDYSIIEEIKYRNDIDDVISGYVALKRAGSNLLGLCPFHSEKTPSFTVFQANKNFYCFGCGAGGDVITFVMKMENLDYTGALEFLAKRAGITIPENKEEKEAGINRRRIYEMNREAAKYFHQSLYSEAGKEALSYLLNRGLTGPLIKHFGIGYAKDSFSALTEHLQNKGYTDEELRVGFFANKSKKNDKLYDYFRNRVMFPIIDTSGNVVAFGGRAISNDTMPKYLNTSDTPAFKKSRNLFALNFAKDTAQNGLILCEGYMDVIALHGAGYTNAVATLGTAITPEQARLMKRYAKSVIISYDSDDAGQRAALKAFSLLTEAGVETRIMRVTGAKDPDEYIKKFGPAAFKKIIEGSKTEFEYKLELILKKYNLDILEDKTKAAEEISSLISGFASAVERDLYILKASELLNIKSESIKFDVEKKLKNNFKKQKRENTLSLFRKSEGFGDRINPDFVKNPMAGSAEETILGILVLFPEYIKSATEKYNLTEDDFFTDFNKRVFLAILDIYDSSDGHFEEGRFSEVFTPDEVGRIIKIKLKRADLSNTKEILEDSIERLRTAKRKKETSIEDILESKRRKLNDKQE